MAYEYVTRVYGVSPVVGQRVQHKETKRFGVVVREDRSRSHYVQVRFDGQNFALSCHPTALDYPNQPEGEAAQ
jgi:hypothetical protein